MVVSTRTASFEKGTSSSLRTFELIDENLVPFDESRAVDNRTRIQIRLSFPDGPGDYEMSTWIQLQDQELITAKHPVCEFLRHYGWSIVFLKGSWTLGDHFVAALAGTISRKGSRLARFDLDPSSLTTPGLQALERILKRIQRTVDFRLALSNLEKRGQVEKGHLLLTRHGQMLRALELHGNSPEQWLPRISASIPTRDSLQRLTSLQLKFLSNSDVPQGSIPWIMAMMALPSKDSQSSQTLAHDFGAQATGTETMTAWTGLRKIGFCNIKLQPQAWKSVIEAIDFTELRHLDLRQSNVSREQLKLLIDRLPDKAPLETIDLDQRIIGTLLTRPMMTQLRKKAPSFGINESRKHPQV
jgi:hypothetical protein